MIIFGAFGREAITVSEAYGSSEAQVRDEVVRARGRASLPASRLVSPEMTN